MKVELADGDFYDIGMETQTTERGQVSVGVAVIFDGAYGWHNTYRLIDLASNHGMPLSEEDRAVVTRTAANRSEADEEFEVVRDLADRAEDHLSDQVATSGGRS